jgi:hypothetical protein
VFFTAFVIIIVCSQFVVALFGLPHTSKDYWCGFNRIHNTLERSTGKEVGLLEKAG